MSVDSHLVKDSPIYKVELQTPTSQYSVIVGQIYLLAFKVQVISGLVVHASSSGVGKIIPSDLLEDPHNGSQPVRPVSQ